MRLIDTIIMSVALMVAVACTEKTPQESDTERLISEALEAVSSHDLRTAEQLAYNAAILSADSAEMADAMTMLSLVFILEDKKEKAEMVMAVLPEGQTMEFVYLQQAANEQGRSRDRYIFSGFIGFLLAVIGGGLLWSRRRKAAFEQKVDELMLTMTTAEKDTPVTETDEPTRSSSGVNDVPCLSTVISMMTRPCSPYFTDSSGYFISFLINSHNAFSPPGNWGITSTLVE